MAGLTAPPDNSEAEAGQMIAADGWFPDIDTAEVARQVRIGDGAVTQARLVAAVTAGILSGLRAMFHWRTAHVLAGFEDLESVTEASVAGENHAVLLWKRLVTFYAAAELLDGHTDIAATDDALDREEDKRITADLYRRKAYEAVADLLAIGPQSAGDRGRNMVELL